MGNSSEKSSYLHLHGILIVHAQIRSFLLSISNSSQAGTVSFRTRAIASVQVLIVNSGVSHCCSYTGAMCSTSLSPAQSAWTEKEGSKGVGMPRFFLPSLGTSAAEQAGGQWSKEEGEDPARWHQVDAE